MLLKNTLKKIKKSFGRYLSLFLIILLGVGFYTGIIESVPNIKNVQIEYYQETNLMDLKIVSTLGLDDEDITAINELKEVDTVVGSYTKDVIVEDNVVRIHSIEKEINKVHLIKGKLPTNNNECLADFNHYKIGDEITINKDYTNDLTNNKYKVVGTIISPIYTSDDYGSANIGNGKIYSYLFIPKDNFQYDYYTETYLTINKTNKDIPYANSYNNKVKKVIDKLEILKKERLTARMSQFMIQSFTNINTNQSIIDSFQNSNWYILDRDNVVSSYVILESQYDQVTTIANVIPLFFIIIVILMTSNTMTRMIAEERGEMGTLTSLGFSNLHIISTYLFYVLSATILGTIIGYFIGTIFLPKLVYNCFPVNFPEITYQFDLSLFLISLLTTCLIMTFVTITSCIKELKQKPAYLLRPIAPKSGKKVLLERINFIWNKLSFSSKVTIRNISRYKKRVLMTLLGTAGCTFLIMIGFALKDSINSIGDKQYTELFKYDNLMILNNNVTSISNDLNITLDSLIENPLLLNQTSYKVVEQNNSLDIYLLVPESTNEYFYSYFQLRDENSKSSLKLNDEGVIITPKIKKRFNIEVGDTITLENLNKEKYQVKVTGITENYVSNYIYMSKKLYEDIFQKKLSYNVIVSKNLQKQNKIATTLLESNQILSISFADDLLKNANNGVSGLNNIVILLVIISSLLAFTVLYNLTSINISERIREIATLKVLGFKDIESNEYIYRETIITVIIGIILGLIITPILHSYIMELLEVDTMVFLKQIKIQSYIYASVLTFSFALIMQIITYFKIKKINMIESLKSVE